MSRFLTGLLSLALLLVGVTCLFAQQPPAEPPPAKLWIESYGIVLLCLFLGTMIFVRPGTREDPKD